MKRAIELEQPLVPGSHSWGACKPPKRFRHKKNHEPSELAETDIPFTKLFILLTFFVLAATISYGLILHWTDS